MLDMRRVISSASSLTVFPAAWIDPPGRIDIAPSGPMVWVVSRSWCP